MDASLYYILMVKCGYEKKALDKLLEEGFGGLCPSFEVERQVRHKKGKKIVVVSKPVLDGYLFVQVVSAPNIALVKIVENVLKVVSFAGTPALIERSDIDEIARLIEPLRLEAELLESAKNSVGKKKRPKGIKPGDRVQVLRGPVQLLGTYLGKDTVEAELLGGLIKFNVKNADMVKLKEAA